MFVCMKLKKFICLYFNKHWKFYRFWFTAFVWIDSKVCNLVLIFKYVDIVKTIVANMPFICVKTKYLRYIIYYDLQYVAPFNNLNLY